MTNDIAVFSSFNQDFVTSINGTELSAILLFEREMATISAGEANLLSNVRALETWRVFGSFRHHIDFGKLLQGPTNAGILHPKRTQGTFCNRR